MGQYSRTRFSNRSDPMRRLARGFENLQARTLLHAGVVELPEGEGIGEMVAEFSLIDVNEASATYTQAISPRDFLGKTTLWYFGHAT